MNTYTVIGLWIDDEPIVAGVIEGKHDCVDGNEGEPGRWAESVEAPDAYEAERLARKAMGWEDTEETEPEADDAADDTEPEATVAAATCAICGKGREVGVLVSSYAGDVHRHCGISRALVF